MKLGCDPELFVKKAGALVSAHGLIPGTKEAPFVVDKGAVQVDGMALEFNIDPANNREEFCANISTVMSIMESMVEGYTFDISAVAHFGREYIDSQPKEAKELGCNPDYNAWTGTTNPRPNVDAPFRTASGHIHIGWTEGADIWNPDHIMKCRDVVVELDYTLGLASVLLDGDSTRRELYGKAGAYRPKTYGCEYRVLSNFWLKEKRLQEWVFNTVEWVLSRVESNQFFSDVHRDKVVDIINASNVEAAQQLIQELGIPLP